MVTYEAALIQLGALYAEAVAEKGGRSLATIATSVASQSSFFARLERGSTCTARNIEKFTAFFGESQNWPGQVIPEAANEALVSMGRPAKATA